MYLLIDDMFRYLKVVLWSFLGLREKHAFETDQKKTQTDCFDCSWDIGLYSIYCCINWSRTNCCIQPAANFRVF